MKIAILFACAALLGPPAQAQVIPELPTPTPIPGRSPQCNKDDLKSALFLFEDWIVRRGRDYEPPPQQGQTERAKKLREEAKREEEKAKALSFVVGVMQACRAE